MNDLLAESDLFVFIHLDNRLEPMIYNLFHRTACSVASYGTFVSRTLPLYHFFFNNSQTLLFAAAMYE